MSQHQIDLIKEKLPQVDVLVFDVDGVLIQSLDNHGRFLWVQKIPDDWGISNDCLKELFGSRWLEVIRGKMETTVHFQKVFRDHHVTISVDDFMHFWVENDQNMNNSMISFLEELVSSNIPVCLGTNQDTFRTERLRSLFAPYIERVYSSCEMGTIKPEAAFFNKIQDHLLCLPERILLVDDTLENVQAAQKAGWQAFHFCSKS